VRIDDDVFPLAALGCGALITCLAVFAPEGNGRTAAIALGTNSITMAGTAYGLRAKYRHYEDEQD
jgi:hypothetical protein